jgi:hypothetical protein
VKKDDVPMIGGADDPEIGARVAKLQEKARNRARAPLSAAIGSVVGAVVGRAFVLLVYALVAVLLLAAFVGLYRVATWLLGAL